MSLSLFVSVCVYENLFQPHASAVCQGASPDGSEDRCLSVRAALGSSVQSRAPHGPTGGDMWSGRSKPHQSEVVGLSGSSLSVH